MVRTFKDVADLPFFILHDVIRKVGIGERLLRPKRRASIEPAAVLSRPIGMGQTSRPSMPGSSAVGQR